MQRRRGVVGGEYSGIRDIYLVLGFPLHPHVSWPILEKRNLFSQSRNQKKKNFIFTAIAVSHHCLDLCEAYADNTLGYALDLVLDLNIKKLSTVQLLKM